MAKKKAKPQPKKAGKRDFAKARVSKVVDQVKEPLSLLNTLKQEGMANMMALLTLGSAVASGAKENLKLAAMKPQLRELISSLGFALKEDFDDLAARVDELEHKLSEKEFSVLSSAHDEEE
jgi:hypothetical protein